MKVVAVCACTVGIAHTWMAKEAIEKECERRGFEYKVEAQGGYGIENELEEEEIAEADAVLLAIAIGIEGDERFDEKRDEGRVLTLDPSLAIADPAKVIDQVVALTQ
ncbi:fructose PTS transporter subunit IIB [Lancefieldella rimae]|uniref:PTS fructose transporter subunit IIB n=1 Tax=Lancefieldella rimae TaxID=1383 RepID=UPI0028F12715|nr:fructose PTS transporter subunit IIB [Lancefieldella rimae]MCR5630451.1 fructose PTS transporter subunit IIB [Atopobiaceae bacterium]